MWCSLAATSHLNQSHDLAAPGTSVDSNGLRALYVKRKIFNSAVLLTGEISLHVFRQDVLNFCDIRRWNKAALEMYFMRQVMDSIFHAL